MDWESLQNRICFVDYGDCRWRAAAFVVRKKFQKVLILNKPIGLWFRATSIFYSLPSRATGSANQPDENLDSYGGRALRDVFHWRNAAQASTLLFKLLILLSKIFYKKYRGATGRRQKQFVCSEF